MTVASLTTIFMCPATEKAFQRIRASIGEVPMLAAEQVLTSSDLAALDDLDSVSRMPRKAI